VIVWESELYFYVFNILTAETNEREFKVAQVEEEACLIVILQFF